MSGRIKGAAVAFGLIIALPVALAQERIEPALEGQPEPSGGQEDGRQASQQEAAPEQSRAPDLLPAIQSIESAIRDLIPQENQRERQWQEYREKADLQAQKRMARWAFWMTIASFAGVLLTAGGVLLVWRTLVHTRKAAEAAAASVVEAREIAVITRDLGVRQIRAYVSITTAVIQDFKDGKRPIITIRIRNTGQSPANRIRVITQYNFRYAEQGVHIRGLLTGNDVPSSIATLGAGAGSFDSNIRLDDAIQQSSIDSVTKGIHIVIVACYISYYDVFQKFRRTTARLILDIGSIRNGVGSFRTDKKGNRTT